MIAFLLLILGFVFLTKGADWFVEGSSNIAQSLHIPSIVIGLTIVAFGTSAPEAAVSISAALKHNSGITFGNVIGSNIFNVLCVLGVTSLIAPITLNISTIRKEIPFMFLSSMLLFVLAFDVLFGSGITDGLSRGDGIVLYCFLIIFIYYLLEVSFNSQEKIPLEEDVEYLPLPKAIIFSILGLAGIVIGGDIVVKKSIVIAQMLGISDTLIGLTVVSFGTSLPELVICVVAALKKEYDIAIGNVVGSNIFNILFVLSSSAVVNYLPISSQMIVDMLVMIGATLLLFLFVFRDRKLYRIEGGLFLLSYFGYLIYIAIRN